MDDVFSREMTKIVELVFDMSKLRDCFVKSTWWNIDRNVLSFHGKWENMYSKYR